MALYFLDTETTGLGPLPHTDIVEVGIVDQDSNTVFHSLANPGHQIPVRASQIHGITDEMVASAPSADEVRMRVLEVCAGHDVVIYNAAYDLKYLPGLAEVASVSCCMERFATWMREPNHRRGGGWKWHKLSYAAEVAGCLEPDAHRALADARMAAGVWRHLEERERHEMAAGVSRSVAEYLAEWRRRAAEAVAVGDDIRY